MQPMRAIYMAAQQLEVQAVAIKTQAQQAVLAIHTIRQQLMKMRTAQMNASAAQPAEYGEVFGTGRKAFDAGTKVALERLPMPLIDTLHDQWNELARLDDRIARIEASLLTWMRQDRAAKAIFAIPGVGLLTATAVVVAMGDATASRSGREFAAPLGLYQARPAVEEKRGGRA